MDEELCCMSALIVAEAIRKQEISCIEVANAILARIEKINPKINAYYTVLTEEARQAAKKADETIKQGKRLEPLHGIPVSIKDLSFQRELEQTFVLKFTKIHSGKGCNRRQKIKGYGSHHFRKVGGRLVYGEKRG